MTTTHRAGQPGRFVGAAGRGMLLAAMLAGAVGGVAVAQPGATETAPATGAAIEVSDADVVRYREHVLTLANPYFEGRRPGSRGNERAAEYIEFWFKEFGLGPVFPSTTVAEDGTEVLTPRSSYRQAFPYGRDVVVEEQSVRVMGAAGGNGAGAAALMPERDYAVLGVSGSGTAEGEVVFAGYGIDDDPSGFTSFPLGEDRELLEGKIAMVMRFEPLNEDGRSKLTGNDWSNAAGLSGKLRAVAERGASAIILTSPPGADDPRVGKLETTASTTRIARAMDIPVIMMSMDAADALVRASGAAASLEELRRVADEGSRLVPLTGAKVRISTRVERPSRTTDNVAGLLPGKGDLKDQYVVVGAHFDHVGDGSLGGSRGGEPGAIHYGADDNASGTAGLLLAAEWMAREYAALPEDADARSVIFMGFSAEEIGLVGSRYFVQNSPVSARSTYAMVNMDMIGRLRNNTLEVHGTGTAERFEELLQPMFDASGMTIAKQPGGRGPSDHASFYGAGVPVLHFFTGLHEEYHTPADISELINVEGGARVAALATRVSMELAMRDEPLVFRGGADSSDPHGGEQARAGSRMGGVRVRFGISPGSYSEGEDQTGVLVGEVFENSSAAEGGVKKGDRLLTWNGKEIPSVQGWMPFLAEANPGDVVEVTVKRGDEVVPLKIKLKGRDQGAR